MVKIIKIKYTVITIGKNNHKSLSILYCRPILLHREDTVLGLLFMIRRKQNYKKLKSTEINNIGSECWMRHELRGDLMRI